MALDAHSSEKRSPSGRGYRLGQYLGAIVSVMLLIFSKRYRQRWQEAAKSCRDATAAVEDMRHQMATNEPIRGIELKKMIEDGRE